METFLSFPFPPVKNAIHCPSGEKNGAKAPSVSGKAVAGVDPNAGCTTVAGQTLGARRTRARCHLGKELPQNRDR